MYSDSCILYLKSYHTHIQVSGLSFRVIERPNHNYKLSMTKTCIMCSDCLLAFNLSRKVKTLSLSLSSSSMSDSVSLSVCCLKGEYGGVMIFRRNDAIFTEIKQILVLTCTNRQSFTVARWNKNVLWLKWFILFHLVTSCLLAELYVDAQLFSCPVVFELYLV